MFVCGDFNSRCGDKEDFIAGVDTLSIPKTDTGRFYMIPYFQ